MLKELLDEVFGLGPLEPLLADPEISDISSNNSQEVYVERHGRLELSDIVFADDQHVLRIIQRVVARVGRRIDEVSPMVDARLPDGSRVNAIVPPWRSTGRPCPFVASARSRWGSRTWPQRFDHLRCHRLPGRRDRRPRELPDSGGTGAGKTTLLNALTAFIPTSERLVTIEDSAD